MRQFWWVWLFALLLTACTPKDDTDTKRAAEVNESQAHYFRESLKLVEQAGRQLQRNDSTQSLLEQALSDMDAGMAMAFKVDTLFLNKLDLRLGKNYQRYFIDGVQIYRLGIEAADLDEQKKGLVLLSRWAQFWGSNQTAILKNIESQ